MPSTAQLGSRRGHPGVQLQGRSQNNTPRRECPDTARQPDSTNGPATARSEGRSAHAQPRPVAQPDGHVVTQRNRKVGSTPPVAPPSVTAPGSRPHDRLRIARSIGTEATRPEYRGDRNSHSARESAKISARIPRICQHQRPDILVPKRPYVWLRPRESRTGPIRGRLPAHTPRRRCRRCRQGHGAAVCRAARCRGGTRRTTAGSGAGCGARAVPSASESSTTCGLLGSGQCVSGLLAMVTPRLWVGGCWRTALPGAARRAVRRPGCCGWCGRCGAFVGRGRRG
jgi:hypothetical protein